VNRVFPAQLDRKVLKEMRAQLERRGPWVPKAFKDILVQLEHRVHRGLMAHREQPEQLA
jgi:hypothetical protein